MNICDRATPFFGIISVSWHAYTLILTPTSFYAPFAQQMKREDANAHHITSNATKIIVYDGPKLGEIVGVLRFCFFALHLDLLYFLQTLNGI